MAFGACIKCKRCVFRYPKPRRIIARDPPPESFVKPATNHGVLASLALCTLLSSLGMSSANIALPTLMLAFGATFQQVQWVVIAYLLAVTTLIVSVGRLGDIAGRRRLLLAGIALFSAGSLLSGLAPSLALLVAARAGQGLGAAVMMALGMAFIGATVSKEKTGSAMGLLGTMSAVGTALGPSLGGLLIDGLGWRAIFLFNVPLGMLTLLLAARYLPPDRPRAATPVFDYLGTVLLAATLGAYALAMTLGGPVLLWAAALGAILFILAELGITEPMIRLGMFRDPALSASLVTSMLVSAVMMATLVVGPFYLSRAFGLDSAAVGMVLSVGPVAAALAGVPAGRLADRFGAPAMALAGLAGLAVAAWALSRMPVALGIPGYLGCIVVMTVNFSLFQTANNTAVMAGVAPDQRGVISGLLNLSRNLGFITGASVMGALYATGGMRTTFTVAACLIVLALAIGVVASWLRPWERQW
jgi:MFS family permease